MVNLLTSQLCPLKICGHIYNSFAVVLEEKRQPFHLHIIIIEWFLVMLSHYPHDHMMCALCSMRKLLNLRQMPNMVSDVGL